MPTLYVTTAGSKIQRSGGQLLVRPPGGEATHVPLELVEMVVLQGRCSVTADGVAACLERGIPVIYLRASGAYQGRLESSGTVTAATLRAQARLAEDPARCLALARRVVAAKLDNMAVVLRRGGEGHDEASAALHADAIAAGEAPTLDALRGHEGAGAARYFAALRGMLDLAWGFSRRVAHPPEGPFNALLGYAYTLLYGRQMAAVQAAGLNPYLGFFHGDREGHATLASDLMEEWRPVVADRVVLAAVHSGVIRPDDFHETPDGPRMEPEARTRFLRHWEQRLDEHVTHPASGNQLPYRGVLVAQALHFARCVREPDAVSYLPMRIR